MKKPTHADTIDPYRPPDLDVAPPSPAKAKRSERTLKFVTVVVLILSVFSLLGGVRGFATAVFPTRFQPKTAPNTNNPELDAAWEVSRQGVLQIHAKYLVVTGAIGVLSLATGTLGCAAAYFILRQPRRFRMLLMAACLGLMAVEAIALLPEVLMRWDMLEIADAMAEQVTDGTSRMIVEMTSRGGTIMLLILGLVFAVAKSCFYIYGLMVARRPETVELFSDETPPKRDETVPAQLA